MNALQRRSPPYPFPHLITHELTHPSLRRRFEQNQEDCTFTVLAILPTAVENIFEALPVEQVLEELQAQRQERLARSVGPSEVSTADLPSAPPSITDGGDEKSLASESFLHTSQLGESTVGLGEAKSQPPSVRSKRNKVQLWNEVKISCKVEPSDPMNGG
jgi:peroxin-3